MISNHIVMDGSAGGSGFQSSTLASRLLVGHPRPSGGHLAGSRRMASDDHAVVAPGEMGRGDQSGGGWVFMAEAEAAGVLEGPAIAPSAAARRRFPGLAAAWQPLRRRRLLKALRELEAPAEMETTIRRLFCPAHPAVLGAAHSGSTAHGVFAGPAGLREGDLVGWYSGELVMSTEVKLGGAYAASFVVDEELEDASRPNAGRDEEEPSVLVDDGEGGWLKRQPAVDIDASRLRTKLAFINDHRWDAMHQRTDPPPEDWPAEPSVEMRQVALRLHDEELLCGVCGEADLEGSDCDAWWPLMGVYAVTDVPAGVELVMDYGEDYWRRMRQLSALHALIEGKPTGVGSKLDTSVIPLDPSDAALWLITNDENAEPEPEPEPLPPMAVGHCQRWQDWRACRSAGRICRASVQPSLLPGAGLGITVSCDLREGDVIFVERPLCALPDLGWGEDATCADSPIDESEGVRCDHCTANIYPSTDGSTLRCPAPACGVAYCSPECKHEAARRYHHRLCGCGSKPDGVEGAWLAFLKFAEECCNEYYVMAARMLAEVLQPEQNIVMPLVQAPSQESHADRECDAKGEEEEEAEGGTDDQRESASELSRQLRSADWHLHSGGAFPGFMRGLGRRIVPEHAWGPVDDLWKLPWADFASVLLWETMEIPTYSDSDDDSSDDEDEGEEEDEEDPELREFFDGQVRKQVVEVLGLLCKCLPAARCITVEEYATTLGMLRRNIVGTTTEGLGIYAYHSCINHSAGTKGSTATAAPGGPNAYVTGDVNVKGAHVIVIAQRDLIAGEEILVDYLPPESVLKQWAAEENAVAQSSHWGATNKDEVPEGLDASQLAALAAAQRQERVNSLFQQYGIPRATPGKPVAGTEDAAHAEA